MAFLRLCPGDNLASVFDDSLALRDGFDGKHPFAMDRRTAGLNAPGAVRRVSKMRGDHGFHGFWGLVSKFGMVNRMGAHVRACVCV
jgi:hypothetical protein